MRQNRFIPKWDLSDTLGNSNIFQDGAGNIGVGMTSPTALLHLASPSNQVLHLSSSSVTGTVLVLENTDTGGSTVSISSTGSGSFGGAGLMRFDNPNGTLRMVVKANGNVGIGTENPASKLDVVGSGTSGIRVRGLGGNVLQIIGDASAADLGIMSEEHARIIAPANRSLSIEIHGNHVDDSFSVLTRPNSSTGNVTNEVFTVRNDTSIQVNGACHAGPCLSDITLKKNITPLSNSLSKISNLRPVRFDWLADEYPRMGLNSGTQTGLIAQEVEEVFPHLVSTDEQGLKRIRYNMELQMHMIQAIKELKAENEVLRTQLAQQNKTLMARLAKLEAQSSAVPVSLH